MRELWIKLLLTTVGCGFALLSAELTLRIVTPASPLPPPPEEMITPEGLYLEDDLLAHRHGANVSGAMVRPEFTVQVDTNSLGLRDREIGRKEADEFRILAIGDSFTFGFGVEARESWVEQLEMLLNARTGAARRFQVVNAGVSGYGTLQEAKSLQELIGPVQPDLVLVGFFSGNDIYDNLFFLGLYENLFGGDVARWLRDNTRLFGRVESVAKRIHYALLHGRAFRITLGAVEDIALLCEAAGAELAFVMVAPQPWRLQVSYALGAGWLARLRRAIRWDPRFEHLTFAQRIAALGPPVFDSLEILEAQPDPSVLFYRTNGHWRPVMHELVARGLAEFLEAEQLIGDPRTTHAQAAGERTSQP